MPVANNTIGMSVPGASGIFDANNSLADQVRGETEEQRKKRLQAMQSSQQMTGTSAIFGRNYGAALGS